MLTHSAPRLRTAAPIQAPTTPRPIWSPIMWKNFQQKEVQKDVFMAFGYGDGGGGPTVRCSKTCVKWRAFPACRRPASDPPATSSVTWKKPAAPTCLPGTVSCTWNTIVAPTPRRAAANALPQGRIRPARRPVPGQLRQPTRPRFRLSGRNLHPGLAAGVNQFHDIIPSAAVSRPGVRGFAGSVRRSSADDGYRARSKPWRNSRRQSGRRLAAHQSHLLHPF